MGKWFHSGAAFVGDITHQGALLSPGTGTDSFKAGPGASAAGSDSVAIGSGAGATDFDAVAIGWSTTAEGGAVAIGSNKNADNGSVAVGGNSNSNSGVAIKGTVGTFSGEGIAIGSGSSVSSSTTPLAIGKTARVNSAARGIAIGSNTIVNTGHTDSVAIGSSASTTAAAQMQLGSPTRPLDIVMHRDIQTINAADWDLADNQAEALSFDAPGYVGLLVLDTTNNAEMVRVGTTAIAADFPNAKCIISQADTGVTSALAYGLVVEAQPATNAYAAQITGVSNSSNLVTGLIVTGRVDDAADTATARAGLFVTNNTHTGGENVALRLQALQSTVGNYALDIQFGDVRSTQAIDWDLFDNDAAALSFDSPGHAGLLVLDTINGTEQVRIGNAASSSDFPYARLIASQTNSGQGFTQFNVGIVGEAIADNSAPRPGMGVLGIGKSDAVSAGVGVYGYGIISASTDAETIGVFGRALQIHSSGSNIALKSEAANGQYNYALYVLGGDIGTPFTTTDWDLVDNQAEALSFDCNGQSGILVIDTTNGAEGVTMAGSLGIGTLSPDGPLEISGTGYPRTFMSGYATSSGRLTFRGARGTEGTPTATQEFDTIGWIDFEGYDSGTSWGRGAQITVTAEENFADTAHGSQMRFYTTGLGNDSSDTHMVISADGNVGIGLDVFAPISLLHISAEAAQPNVTIDRYGDTPTIQTRRATGTKASPTQVLTGDVLGQFTCSGYTNAGYATVGSANINFEAAQNFNNGVSDNLGCHIVFETTPIDSGSRTEKMRLTSEGQLLGGDGAAATPMYSFANATGLGIYNASNDLGIAVGGQQQFYVTTGYLRASNASGGAIRNGGGSLNDSTLMPRRDTTNVGIGGDTSGNLALITTGAVRMTVASAGSVKVTNGFAAWDVTPPSSQPTKISDPTDLGSCITAITAIIDVLEGAGLSATT